MCAGYEIRAQRSIPARTGEPTPFRAPPGLATVYPRAYGGTANNRRGTRRTWGLSPRVRGNRSTSKEHPVEARSIPARTGEPQMFGDSIQVVKVYPRAYGEPSVVGSAEAAIWVYPRAYGGTAEGTFDTERDTGLSPRVRGNPLAARPLAKPNSSRVTPLVVLYQVHSVGIDYGLWRRAQRPDALLPRMVCSPKPGPAVMLG